MKNINQPLIFLLMIMVFYNILEPSIDKFYSTLIFLIITVLTISVYKWRSK